MRAFFGTGVYQCLVFINNALTGSNRLYFIKRVRKQICLQMNGVWQIIG